MYICRSEKSDSKVPRGGVAIFKNISCNVNIEVLCDTLRDCAVFKVSNTDLIIAALYIPPQNSVYYNDMYFENLDLIYTKFKDNNLLLVGDINARIGTPAFDNSSLNYSENPDIVINSHGRKLLKWIAEKDMAIINGLMFNCKAFDTKFTYFRGKLCSQNDVAFSNRIHNIDNFKIKEKNIYSDHCPIQISCTVSLQSSLDIVYKCAKGCFNDNHNDINRRLKVPIKLSRVDVRKAVTLMDTYATELKDTILEMDNDILSTHIANNIYESCKRSYKQRVPTNTPLAPNLQNCNSKNFKAIAEANFYSYVTLANSGASVDRYLTYIENWMKFEDMAKDAENNELNSQINTSWKDCKKDGKKLWNMIDWKGKAEVKKEEPADESETTKYFTEIFQSSKTKSHPVVSDVMHTVESYDTYIPILDDNPTMNELEIAISKIGNGVSMDGIPPSITKILPYSMKEVILTLLQRVFFYTYPSEWSKQILHSIKKDGHSPTCPKLRGIAIAPLLCRLYDIIIDIRFTSWYTPNYEQAGFRPRQGCLLQLFMLLILIQFASEKKKDLFVGFMDYEKAFDFTNRASIISNLIESGCGSFLTRAIAKMFSTSSYFPKLGFSNIGDGIDSNHGVAQGRRTSGNLFSFFTSDIATALQGINSNDFMDPFNIAQLADDTAFYAENVESLRSKFKRIFAYSSDKYQIPNTSKTKYCHFSKSPSADPIVVDEHIIVNSVTEEKGYKYLGMLFFPTNDITKIVTRNVNNRVGSISKFYAWLDINEHTPLEIKLMVLDNCMFSAILYGVEAWGDISYIEHKLTCIEMKALKAIMKVKKGTTNDLILHELRRCSIIAKIKDRQFNFFQKLARLHPGEAIVNEVIRLCRESNMIHYYLQLQDKNSDRDIVDREHRIRDSTASMCVYYSEFKFRGKSCIYSSFLNDYHRYIITRWRLSNHDLKIETGRYSRPITPREDRLCDKCGTLENEFHVIFQCELYKSVREKFPHIIASGSITDFLDPAYNQMKDTARFLHEVEVIRKSLTSS